MTTIPWQDRVESFTHHVQEAKRGTIFSVQGSTGRGKTRLLRDLAAQLARRGSIPLYLSPPQDEDTAGAALAAAADALKASTLLNGQTETLKDVRASREEKIGIVVESIRQAANSVVLLLDEPGRWAAGKWSEKHSVVGRRFARQVGQALVSQTGCRVVYTGPSLDVGVEETPYFLPKAWNQADLPRALKDQPVWHEIKANLTESLAEQATPLFCRLLTMLSLLTTPAEAVEAARTSIDIVDIASILKEKVAQRPEVQRAWACFALVRTTMDQMLVESLAGELGDGRFLVEDLLLTRIKGGYELHPVLTQSMEPKKVLGIGYGAVQQRLTQFYLGRKSYLADATEAFFHATEAGEEELLAQVQPFFIEQLHLRGRSLSRQKKHQEAAEIFRQALELDPTDDYAHHYRAFNLDWIAKDQPTIEEEYQQAIKHNPRHPWWHSRWITYLITVGNIMGARSAFASATESLQEAMETHPESVYQSLHSWVAALLLHRGQLEFARQVLDRVPEHVRREHRGFVALGEKLAALEEARRGRGVFPLFVPASQHWRKSPHLDFPPQVDGKQLLAWYPARVDSVSEQSVTLIVGKPPEGGGPPTYGRIHLSPDRLNAATLDEQVSPLRPGRFLELAFYGEEGVLKIRSHPQEASVDPDLPYLNPPDTLRYLRKQEQQP